ncbi:MAG: alpha/beta fold hydrolase [Comamonadaceae bacterium]|nr:MAG: alpha/beta fold hydrolase [Comamonadaceae bacterium]
MNAQTEKSTLAGPAGAIEIAIDRPAEGVQSRGVAVIAHPHPLFGGTMDNKVVQTLARAFVQSGWTAVRFNFRGVGATEGAHDEGRGELDDLLAVVSHAAPDGALCLAGFSFGAFVTTHAFERLHGPRDVEKLVLVGTSVIRSAAAPVNVEAHPRALVIHGEKDETVQLAAVMDWARPQGLPVMVIPGCGHFFHGQLPLLKNLVVRHLSSALPDS